MPIPVQCECGRRLVARDEFEGARARCPSCGKILVLRTGPDETPALEVTTFVEPSTSQPGGSSGNDQSSRRSEPLAITEFLDPPQREVPPRAAEAKPSSVTLQSMLEALLDPRSIHWMLMLGGGLLVLGALIWLVSLGIFKNPALLAVLMGAGSLAVLGGGWWMSLRTRFRTAGQALTFLGCVVLPLNLWFHDAQGLITIDQHLWVGGVICCLLYGATVYVLRDPLFLYAVEAGLSLTILLLLANLRQIQNTTSLCLFLVGMGLASILAERAFPPADEAPFNRRRFGLPLFWSGHVQLAIALSLLLGTQVAGWLFSAERHLLGFTWEGNLLSGSAWVAGGLWLAAAAAYVYSDLVVRRVGWYVHLAAGCLLLAEFTLVGDRLSAEWLPAVLALTALAANVIRGTVRIEDRGFIRPAEPLAAILSALPICMGFALHLRATSPAAQDLFSPHSTGWAFVVSMVVVGACCRLSAYLLRRESTETVAAYFFLSAAAVLLAAAGLLRQLEFEQWLEQAPLLMLIPLAYLIAARLWIGRLPERPLTWVAQTAVLVILLHGVGAIAGPLAVGPERTTDLWHLFRPVAGERNNLLLGLVFVEAALFYALAGVFDRQRGHSYFAAVAGCGAVWQFIGYWGAIDPAYHTILYAILGIGVLLVGRMLGLEEGTVYDDRGRRKSSVGGPGLQLFHCGNAILGIALLAALMQGLTRAAADQATWLTLSSLVLTTLASGAAVVLVPGGGWRRLYTTSTAALTLVCLLTLNVLSDLSLQQKLEIFSVACGVLLLIVSSIGRFQESAADHGDSVGLGMFVGSLLATVPLLIALGWYRFGIGQVHWPEELALVVLTILMLVTGVSWQVKSTTIIGGAVLLVYVLVTLGQLAYFPQAATGVYLTVGGGAVFLTGLVLSMFRERLLKLPSQVQNREGVFQVLQWR